MKTNPTGKACDRFTPVQLPDRRWPEAIITRPPIWCSVDLRDGNQALVEPMGPERKGRFFNTLVAMGFKEIGLVPAALQHRFRFCPARLIDENRIPEDVTIQVLTQAREDLIRRTFESIQGCRRAIVHLYNSTLKLQRRVVTGLDRTGITKITLMALRSSAICSMPLARARFPSVFARKLHRYRTRLCQGGMRGHHGRVSPYTFKQVDPQSSSHGRDGDAQHLCRSNRMVLPQHKKPRLDYPVSPPAQ